LEDKEMTELPWMAEAKKHIGLKEIVGAKHNLTIKVFRRPFPDSTQTGTKGRLKKQNPL